jgi:hypothetical protein
MPSIQMTKVIKFSFILLIMISTNASSAFYDSRIKKWEVYLAPQITDSKDLQFDNGASANIEKDSSLGFGFGYNINSHIELALEFVSNNSNYTSTAIPENPTQSPVTNRGSLYTSTVNFGFTFNFLSTPFTPYVTANLGSTYIDSGVFTGNVVSGCWYYPYWGYVCGPVAQTYTSTELSYGAALGLRYDFNRKLFMKGEARKSYIDSNSNNDPDFDSLRFIFGFMF